AENIGRIQPGASLCEPEHYFQNGAEVVEFSRLGWVDPAGNRIPDFNLSLRYEFFPDGTVFCSAILHVETAHPPVCRNFKLVFPFDFSSFDDCRFADIAEKLGTKVITTHIGVVPEDIRSIR
ncbi:MAG: hypothetical protein IJH79_05775, partial [Lentisphaeria bacterium]|nr:hypothetical protein [Lentisphaeria bacterium]